MKRTLAQNVDNYFRYSAIMSNAHYDMAEVYRARHRKFGVVVVVITSMVGATALGSLKTFGDQSQQDGIKLAIGLLSLLATVLAALQTFLAFSDLQAQHKRAGDGYSIARREVESFMMKYPDASGISGEKGSTEFDALKKVLDDLDVSSPTIPDDRYDRAARKTPLEAAS